MLKIVPKKDCDRKRAAQSCSRASWLWELNLITSQEAKRRDEIDYLISGSGTEGLSGFDDYVFSMPRGS